MAFSGSERTRHGPAGWAARPVGSFAGKEEGAAARPTVGPFRHGFNGWVTQGVTFVAKEAAEVDDDVNVPGPIRRKKRYILPNGRVVHSYQAAIDGLQEILRDRPEDAPKTPTPPKPAVVEAKDSALLVAPMDAVPADIEAVRIQAQRERQALIELKAMRDEDDAIALLLLIN